VQSQHFEFTPSRRLYRSKGDNHGYSFFPVCALRPGRGIGLELQPLACLALDVLLLASIVFLGLLAHNPIVSFCRWPGFCCWAMPVLS
jgi:hypothetical protein